MPLMSVRLATVAPDLVDLLASLSDDQVGALVIRAAREAVTRTGLTNESVTTALGLEGTTPHPGLRASVENIVASLDDCAWGIQEREGDSASYLATFQQARAASAAAFALDPDVRGAGPEALYEAQAALGSVDELRSVLAI